ncbi:MAG: hypothetical protein WBC60_07210 [Cognaticolwellia sp.]
MKIYCCRYLLAISLFLISMNAQSALSPTMMNLRDLNILVEFIEQHEKVAETLERIDFASYTIVFNNNCKVYFHRPKANLFTLSMPGPQPSIQFKSSTCLLTYDNKEGEK